MAEKNEEKRAVANEKQQKKCRIVNSIEIQHQHQHHYHRHRHHHRPSWSSCIAMQSLCMCICACVCVCPVKRPRPNSHRQHFPAFTISLIGCIFFRSLLHFHISLLTILFLFPCPSLSYSLYLPPLFLPLCNCLLYSPYQYGSEVRRVNLTSVWHVNACCPSSTFTHVCVCLCVRSVKQAKCNWIC